LFELLMYGPKEILGLLEDDCDGTGDWAESSWIGCDGRGEGLTSGFLELMRQVPSLDRFVYSRGMHLRIMRPVLVLEIIWSIQINMDDKHWCWRQES
jgi:hypothetical protein